MGSAVVSEGGVSPFPSFGLPSELPSRRPPVAFFTQSNRPGMAQRYQTLRVLPGATPSPKNPKQHLSSPSAEELFRELGDHSYHFSSSGSTSLTPITTPTPSPVMADRFPSLEDIDIDIVPGKCYAGFFATFTPGPVAIHHQNEKDQLC